MKYKFWCELCKRWDDNALSFADGDTGVAHNCNKGTGESGTPPDLSQVEFDSIYCITCRQDLDVSCLDPLSGLVFHDCPGPEQST